jgi:hypothetical protein
MRHHRAVHSINDDIEVAVDEFRVLVGELGIGLVRAFRFDESDGFVHHRDRFVLGAVLRGEGGNGKAEAGDESGHRRELHMLHFNPPFVAGISSGHDSTCACGRYQAGRRFDKAEAKRLTALRSFPSPRKGGDLPYDSISLSGGSSSILLCWRKPTGQPVNERFSGRIV